MKRPTDLIFNMEHQFTLYLQRCGLTRAQLGVDQLREIRRAFYGGLGQMFFLITQDVADLMPKDHWSVLSLFRKTIGDFWTEEQRLQEQGLYYLHATSPIKCECGWSGQINNLTVPGISGEMCSCPKCGSVNLLYKS